MIFTLATLSLGVNSSAVAPLTSNLIDAGRLPLSTKGRFVIDNAGARVKLGCVNWYGAHMELYAVAGGRYQIRSRSLFFLLLRPAVGHEAPDATTEG